jgi:ABC-type nitrate/sulfonate/bicarbonate transport system substrate-binding protein
MKRTKDLTITYEIPTDRIFFLLVLLVSNHSFVQAASPLTKVVMTTGSLSEREGVLYVAQDQGFFRKYGLDLTLVQVQMV